MTYDQEWLEPEGNGKFVAIGLKGEVIVGKRDGEVLKRCGGYIRAWQFRHGSCRP